MLAISTSALLYFCYRITCTVISRILCHPPPLLSPSPINAIIEFLMSLLLSLIVLIMIIHIVILMIVLMMLTITIIILMGKIIIALTKIKLIMNDNNDNYENR